MPKSHVDYWRRKFELNQERDARKTAELEAAGWNVVTIWECEIRDNPEGVLRVIRETLGPEL